MCPLRGFGGGDIYLIVVGLVLLSQKRTKTLLAILLGIRTYLLSRLHFTLIIVIIEKR